MTEKKTLEGLIRFCRFESKEYPDEPGQFVNFSSYFDRWNPWGYANEFSREKFRCSDDLIRTISNFELKLTCAYGTSPVIYDRLFPNLTPRSEFMETSHGDILDSLKETVNNAVNAKIAERGFGCCRLYVETRVEYEGIILTDRFLYASRFPASRVVCATTGYFSIVRAVW